jgi:hypothetical protein
VVKTVLHFEEAKKIWQTYVPKSGQSASVQGELLRAVEKLRDEAIRNGNVNWTRGSRSSFDILNSIFWTRQSSTNN